jgi:hypothetical protein
LLTLGRPKLPARKNGTEAPFLGTGSVRLLENAPEVPARKATSPPVAVDTPVIFTLTVGVTMPVVSVTRIRHGDGAHETNPALGLVLLLICNSTFIVMPS